MDLNERIHQELEEAQPADSGQFTISLRDMLSKLAKFQGQGQPWWMARFVQAAVSAECKSLRVKASGLLEFETGPAWQSQAVYEGLLHPERPVEKWLEHLRRGLWACGWQDQLQFELRFAGEDRAIQVKDGQPELVPLRCRETSLQVQTRLDRAPLQALAHPCPLPLFWGSELIPGVHSIRPETIAVGADQHSGVQLSVARGGPHLLHWVEDGVILESETIWPEGSQSGLFLWGYLDAKGLPRDASGYGLVQGCERNERLRQGLSSLLKQGANLRCRQGRSAAGGTQNPFILGFKVGLGTLGIGWLFGDPGLGTLAACFTSFLAGLVRHEANGFTPESPSTEERVALLKFQDSLQKWHRENNR